MCLSLVCNIVLCVIEIGAGVASVFGGAAAVAIGSTTGKDLGFISSIDTILCFYQRDLQSLYFLLYQHCFKCVTLLFIGVAVIGSLFGVAGAGLSGFKMKRRVGEVEEFEFKPLNKTSLK